MRRLLKSWKTRWARIVPFSFVNLNGFDLQLLKLKEQREALKLQGQKHEDTIMKVLNNSF